MGRTLGSYFPIFFRRVQIPLLTVLRVQIQEISTQADRLSKGQSDIQSGLTTLDTQLQGLEHLSEVPDIVAKAKCISEEVRTELCALAILGRLGSSNQRFWDVPKADSHTFHWILQDEIDRSLAKHDDEHYEDDRSDIPDDEEQDSDGEEEQAESPWEAKERVEYEKAQSDVNARLATWLQHGSGLFHVAGKPGSGKSTLMKHLSQHPKVIRSLEEWAQPKRLALGKFFFWKPDHGQNSLDALMRGLLYNLIHYDAGLVHSAFPRCNKDSFEHLSLQSRLDVTKEEISEAFNNLISNRTVSERFNFCFFIDGLDELDEGKDITHLQIARRLQEWTNTAKASVKVCVSSRPFPVFEDMPVDHRIQLQDLTKYDMTSFVHHTLRSVRSFRVEMRRNSRDCQRLIKAIVDGSDGVFLWVSLVTKSVERGLSNEDPVAMLLQRIRSTPRELEALFESLLKSIEDCHAQTALLLLAVTMYFQTGWDSGDLIISLPVCRQFFRARETSPRGSIDTVFHPNNPPETFDWTREEARKTKSQLAFRCKGLLEIVKRPNGTNCYCDGGGWVTLIHRSIPEFLERWIPDNMRAQGFTFDHIHNAMCWMLWAKILFESSTTNLEHLSVNEACSRSSISNMAQVAVSSLQGSNSSTAFQLLDLSEDALLPVLAPSEDHAKGNDGNIEGPTRNTVCFPPPGHSVFQARCPFFASPLVAAARVGCHRYLGWRLSRTRRVYAPCGDNIQHCLQSACELFPYLDPPPIKARVLDWMQVVHILIHAAGANVNDMSLRCRGKSLAVSNEAGMLPSIFDATWIMTFFHPLYCTVGFRNDCYFYMIQLLLELGATPRSVICVANDWTSISSLQPGSSGGIELGSAEETPGISYRARRDNKVFNERLRMICGQNDGIISLEKWVKHAKPENMMAILQLIERNTGAKAEVVDFEELPPTERTRAAALQRHDVHREGKLIWLEDDTCGMLM